MKILLLFLWSVSLFQHSATFTHAPLSGNGVLLLFEGCSETPYANIEDNAHGIWVTVYAQAREEGMYCILAWTIPKTFTRSVTLYTDLGNYTAVTLSEFRGVALLSYPTLPIPKELKRNGTSW